MGVLEAAAGTSGDSGRLLGAAGDGGLFLGFGVLRGGGDGGGETLSEVGRHLIASGENSNTFPKEPLQPHLEDASELISHLFWDIIFFYLAVEDETR